jgi:hypothetical protein
VEARIKPLNNIYMVEMCAFVAYYAALSGSSVPTFWDNLSVPFSRVKESKMKASWTR